MNKVNEYNFDILDKQTQAEVKKLVTARLQVSSDDLRVAIGSTEYTKEELLNHVDKEDEVGKEIMEIQLEYLQDIAKGAIYKES